MNSREIPYNKTGFFSEIVLDYLEGKEALRPFYTYEPHPGSLPLAIQALAGHIIDRHTLVQTLEEQYLGFDAHERVRANIARLESGRTYTVTAAHQLNIFTGPLYYIYKILNVIRAARDMNRQYPEYDFIPCFWMGSEDHDFEEVNHIHLFGKRLEWKNYQGGSLGSYSTDGIAQLIPAIRGILRKGDHLEEVMQVMLKAYSRPLLADSVREMLNSLFGKYGLVVIDGNCKSLKSPFLRIIREELTQRSSRGLVDRQIEALEKAGYRPQAAGRELNLFYAEGRRRSRIIPEGEGFILDGDSVFIDRREMLQIAESHPERFSPNVILRPLHQQIVLPNAAFIGGGSEVAYWLQLRSLFAHYHVHFPMLLLRTSAQWIAPHVRKNLDRLGLGNEDIFLPADTLKRNYVTDKHEDLELSQELQGIEAIFKSLQQKAAALDASLVDWIGAEGQKSLRSIENISKRLIRAAKANDEQNMVRIDKLREQLFPSGNLQERHENFMSLYSDKGPDLFDDMLEALNPFGKKFYLLEE